MRRSVTLVDYGLGNLYSVQRALTHLGVDSVISRDPAGLVDAHHVILPGVGAFGDGMAQLRERGFVEPLRAHARAGKPLLGICLGMQLLFSRSEEFGLHDGLDIIPGQVLAIPTTLGVKIPHMGWNRLVPSGTWSSSILASVEAGAWAYFVHSFAAHPTDPERCIATTSYGGRSITAVAQNEAGNVAGCQFHPEVSSTAGLGILRSFLAVGSTPAPAV